MSNIPKPVYIEKKLDTILKSEMSMHRIECPKYEYPITGLKNGEIMKCYVSDQEPEDLIPRLSPYIEDFSDAYMNWREDIGIWSSIFTLRGSNWRYGIDVGATGLSSYTREDNLVNKSKSLLSYIINASESVN